MDFLYEYLAFLAKSVTLVIAILVVLSFIIVLVTGRKKAPQKGEMDVTDLSEQYQQRIDELSVHILPVKDRKAYEKAKKREKKREKGQESEKPIAYLIEFNGDMNASAVESLRHEITAILAVATDQDEVILKLESPGGVVHGYGLAASQLMRLRQRNIPLTVAVDKVAASGGYMMACTAHRIVAAPFAILGSIGVVAQIPNFNRFLKRYDVDVELETAGEYKRTLTMFGENTESGREKFKEELNETHELFKAFVKENRPTLAIDQVATGEHWYGLQALDNGLIDEICTSDDLILSRIPTHRIVAIHYHRTRSKWERLFRKAALQIERHFYRNGKTG